MPYENFPYADLHNLNLDWLLKQVKEDHEKLEGTDFGELIDESVQEAIDDGRIGDLINQTLLDDINDDIHDLNSDVAGLTSRVGTLEGKVSTHTGQIENLFQQIDTATVAMLGCPAVNTLDSARGYSLCMVIHGDNFCIVYDMGNDNAATLITYLENQSIERIDAMIISHYHSDHVQSAGVNALLNSGIPITKWYLPHGLIDWNSYTGTGYESVANTIKGQITGAGDSWMEPTTEGYAVTLGGYPWSYVQFFNLSPVYYAGYYSYMKDEDYLDTTYTNYNNFSMCCRVRVGGKLLALTGDIEMPAQENMAGMIRGADVLQIPHHGLDLIDSETFRTAMSGKIFLTAAYGVARSRRLETVCNLMVKRAGDLGTSLSTVNDTTIILVFGGLGVYVGSNSGGKLTPAGYFGDVLRPGADLDDLVEIGREYFIQNASDASGIYNKPETGAGRIRVCSTNQNSNDSTGSIMQYYETIFSYAHPKIYVRWKYEGTWTSWMQYEATSISP